MLKQLFLKKPVGDIFSDNLFISLDNSSGLKHDYHNTLNLLKKYDYLEIILSKEKILPENYKEELYIIKTDNVKYFFARLVFEKERLADVLVYTITIEEIEKYKNIFFSSLSFVPSLNFINYQDKLSRPNVCFIKDKNHFKLIDKTNEFLNLIGYEDWDFENKYQNYLDMILDNNSVELINEYISSRKEDYIKIVFKTNDILELKLNILEEMDKIYYFLSKV